MDFSKKLGKGKAKKPIDPLEIYDTLDRASNYGRHRDGYGNHPFLTPELQQ